MTLGTSLAEQRRCPAIRSLTDLKEHMSIILKPKLLSVRAHEHECLLLVISRRSHARHRCISLLFFVIRDVISML